MKFLEIYTTSTFQNESMKFTVSSKYCSKHIRANATSKGELFGTYQNVRCHGHGI